MGEVAGVDGVSCEWPGGLFEGTSRPTCARYCVEAPPCNGAGDGAVFGGVCSCFVDDSLSRNSRSFGSSLLYGSLSELAVSQNHPIFDRVAILYLVGYGKLPVAVHNSPGGERPLRVVIG